LGFVSSFVFPAYPVKEFCLLKIILVRHGETEWNKIHRLQGGGSDTPLNETGLQQAESVALRLKGEKLQAVYSSPLQRARRTAEAIVRYHQLPVIAVPALKEIEVGKLEGADSLAMKFRWDQLLSSSDNEDLKINGVELISEVQKRTWDVITEIALKHTEGTLAVVSHYVAIMAIVCSVLDLPLAHIVYLRLDSATITVFTLNEDGAARLELFNDGCHNRS
jgi:broad specificity phosphatase PhoE